MSVTVVVIGITKLLEAEDLYLRWSEGVSASQKSFGVGSTVSVAWRKLVCRTKICVGLGI